MVGRAADELSPYLPAQTALPAKCPLPDYLGADIRAPNTVEIHPGGWVNLCAGLALGNARQRPLDEILADYDPHAHPIIRVLAQEGPPELLKLAQRHGYSPARAMWTAVICVTRFGASCVLTTPTIWPLPISTPMARRRG